MKMNLFFTLLAGILPQPFIAYNEKFFQQIIRPNYRRQLFFGAGFWKQFNKILAF